MYFESWPDAFFKKTSLSLGNYTFKIDSSFVAAGKIPLGGLQAKSSTAPCLIYLKTGRELLDCWCENCFNSACLPLCVEFEPRTADKASASGVKAPSLKTHWLGVM